MTTYTSLFSFPTSKTFVKGYSRQDKNNYIHDNYYFRGGNKQLASVEKKIKQIADIQEGNVVLTTSGMSAVATALDIAGLTKDSVVIHSATLYGQTADYISVNLPAERGIIALGTDSGNIEAIEKILQEAVKKYTKEQIKVIFLETICNGPDMSVLDIKKFLSLPILQKINPLIIIDNTLPTNSTIPLAKYIQQSSLRIVGLESATKFYLYNQDLGGILFTYHADTLQQLLTRRKRIGTTPGPSLLKTWEQLLPTKQQFDKDNLLIMNNTFTLANICAQAKGCGTKFDVLYPNLSYHPQYNFVEKNYNQGSAPVFFIISKNPYISAEKLFYKLEKLHAFTNIIFTESFGFNTISVSYASRKGGYIRIAGGKESTEQTRKLGKQLQQALSQI